MAITSYARQYNRKVYGRRMIAYSSLIVSAATIVGIIIGAVLNEALRRVNRRELFAPKIFEKRLAAYEGLMTKIH